MFVHVADGQLNRESTVSTINRFVVQNSNEIAKPVKVSLCTVLYTNDIFGPWSCGKSLLKSPASSMAESKFRIQRPVALVAQRYLVIL